MSKSATHQSRVSPSRTTVCTARKGKQGGAGPSLLPSLHAHSLHAGRGFAWAMIAHWSREGDKEGWHLPASPMQSISCMDTCLWRPASNSCLHWAHPENCRLLQWLAAQVPEEGLKTAKYPYILRSELLSCCSQALLSPKGKYFSKERQGAGYHAKLLKEMHH